MKAKMKIKKGDYVQVVSGEEVGKRGRVLRVVPGASKVIVEGINFIYRHLRRSQKHMQGGRIQKEAPIHISKVRLYCHHCQEVTGVCYRYEQEPEAENKGKKEEAVAPKPKKVRCCKCPKHLKV